MIATYSAKCIKRYFGLSFLFAVWSLVCLKVATLFSVDTIVIGAVILTILCAFACGYCTFVFCFLFILTILSIRFHCCIKNEKMNFKRMKRYANTQQFITEGAKELVVWKPVLVRPLILEVVR